jgi:hypothetical protein
VCGIALPVYILNIKHCRGRDIMKEFLGYMQLEENSSSLLLLSCFIDTNFEGPSEDLLSVDSGFAGSKHTEKDNTCLKEGEDETLCTSVAYKYGFISFITAISLTYIHTYATIYNL